MTCHIVLKYVTCCSRDSLPPASTTGADLGVPGRENDWPHSFLVVWVVVLATRCHRHLPQEMPALYLSWVPGREKDASHSFQMCDLLFLRLVAGGFSGRRVLQRRVTFVVTRAAGCRVQRRTYHRGHSSVICRSFDSSPPTSSTLTSGDGSCGVSSRENDLLQSALFCDLLFSRLVPTDIIHLDGL